jgi:O-antigen ligase
MISPVSRTLPRRIDQVDSSASEQVGKGFVFSLIALYLFLDLVRPSFVWHFPKLITIGLLIAWVMKSEKVWCYQILGYVGFIAILAGDILIAENTYDAVWTTYGMFVLLIGVCLPLINFTDTLAKLRNLIHALLLIFAYIGLYAILSAGFGPAGAAGGQDENYVAASMNLVIPLAIFSFFAEDAKWKKAFFLVLVGVYVLAIVVGLSRGGFVGLLCALGYSLMKSPRRGLAILAAVLIGAFLVVVAGSSYWDEMSTITDTSEGTADMRLELWAIATREFLAYPLTGVGGDNYRWRMHEFESPEQMAKFGRILIAHVHSTYFQLLAEMGLAGCLLFGGILLRTYRDYRQTDQSITHVRSSNAPTTDQLKEDLKWVQAYARGLMGGLIGYLASAAFLSALYYSHLWIAVSLIIALHVIAKRMVKVTEPISFIGGGNR